MWNILILLPIILLSRLIKVTYTVGNQSLPGFLKTGNPGSCRVESGLTLVTLVISETWVDQVFGGPGFPDLPRTPGLTRLFSHRVQAWVKLW